MNASGAIPLHPSDVTYRGQQIKLTYRPATNDWRSTVIYTSTITLTDVAPRYDTAVSNAKRRIDLLLGRGR